MSEYDVQADIMNLRREIQSDRLSTITEVRAGFASLHTRMDEHIEDDNAVARRVDIIEDRQGIFGKLMWGIYLSFLAALSGWWFRH